MGIIKILWITVIYYLLIVFGFASGFFEIISISWKILWIILEKCENKYKFVQKLMQSGKRNIVEIFNYIQDLKNKICNIVYKWNENGNKRLFSMISINYN